jgi:hypothetical protein
VDLFYRKGYIAAKDARPNQKETAGQMENALHTPLDAAGISMTARVSVNPGKPGARRVILTIDAADVAMEQRGGRWRGDLKIEVARQSRDGSDLGSVSQTVHMDFDAPLYERLRAQGYVIVRDVDPAPTLTQVKIVVFDATSNRLGSLTVPID